MIGIVVFCAAIMAGLIQTVTGFGSGIFMMLFLPQFFPLLKASALSGSVTLMVNGGVAWKYRKYSQKKYTLLPAVFFIISSSLAIAWGKYLPTMLLKKIFGGFLLLLSLYFMFADQNKKRKASIAAAVICALLSGVLGGLFGISGPPGSCAFEEDCVFLSGIVGRAEPYWLISTIRSMTIVVPFSKITACPISSTFFTTPVALR